MVLFVVWFLVLTWLWFGYGLVSVWSWFGYGCGFVGWSWFGRLVKVRLVKVWQCCWGYFGFGLVLVWSLCVV